VTGPSAPIACGFLRAGGLPDPTLGKSTEKLFLVYDGDCPFCSAYVRYVRIQKALGRLQVVNARDGGALMESIKKRGIDLNEGMVLILDDEYYFGSECMHRLALMSTGSGWFNALNATIFSRPLVAKLLYPCLKFGRRITLRLLGRSKLD
jgi:predicted DCC family thiol-disulfide oxidoreductase YuxK